MYTTVPLKLREIVADHGAGEIIVDPPEMPGRVVRMLKPSKLAVYVNLARLQPPELVPMAEAHFNELRRSGVRVPGFEFYLDGEDLFVVSDQIDGWPIKPPRTQRVLDCQQPRPISDDLRDSYSAEARAGLRTYGQTLKDPVKSASLGDLMLIEITPEKQWMVGTSLVEPEAGEGYIMIDPDPAFFDANPKTIAAHLEWSNNLR